MIINARLFAKKVTTALLLCTLAGFAAPSSAADLATGDHPKRKVLNIGVNIGIFSRVDESQTDEILKRIAADGFKYVRIMDPFARHYEKHLLRRLRMLVDLGFYVDFNMGNMPRRFLPSKPIRDRYIEAILANPYFPRKKIQRHRKRFTKIGDNFGSNRFPPQDIKKYQAFLEGFLIELKNTFGKQVLSNWFFEFGNEPEAPLYFHGLPEDFEKLSSITFAKVKKLTPYMKVGGAGYTSTLVAKYKMNANYYTLARKLAAEKNSDFLSFHIYHKHHNDYRRLNERVSELTRGIDKMKMITEYNISGGRSKLGQTTMLSKEKFMKYLIDMVAVCWKNDISHLYIHNLRDHPKNIKQYKIKVGLFYATGAPGNHGIIPKKSYAAVLLMKAIVKAGFSLIESDHMITIKGQNSMIIKSIGRDNRFDYSNYKIIDSSFSLKDKHATRLPKGEWALLEYQ